MEKLSLYHYFYIFIIASFVGWVLEGIYTYITRKEIINHSALVIGPFDVAYGICACFLTALLYKFRKKKIAIIFLIGLIGGDILEYIMSLGMEYTLGFPAWDYSNRFLNIKGRICLLNSILWGLLAIVWIKFIFPYTMLFINGINITTGKRLMIVLIIFMIFDLILTIQAVKRARRKEKGIPANNYFERFLDKTFNKKYLKNMFNNRWE